MKNSKQSITLKVLLGYVLIAALGVFAIWFVFGQIKTLSNNTDVGNINNQKLFLVSEAATNLYVAEGISKEIIQNQNDAALPEFKAQIDTIHNLVADLKDISGELKMNQELDSIKTLLDLKTQNLEELLLLRKESTTESYYAKVINRLQEVDDSFEEENYEEQLSDLDPTARKAVIGLIEFSKENREEELTQKTADSLVSSLKNVLNNLELEERRKMLYIRQKENELLENDRFISNQLQSLRAAIEQEEIQKSVEQVTASQNAVEETSDILLRVAIGSVATILIFVVLIFKDTNRSQKYRQRLEDSKRYTETLLKSREQIMATVTHDLRSPLNTVIGYSDLLERTPLNGKQKHYLSQLKNSSDYILRLVNDLLDLTKLEAGKMKVENLRFHLANVIQNAIQNVIPEEDPKNLEVVVSIEEKLQQEILSDPFRIQQLLTNLLSNAYKFTASGKIKIDAYLATINKNPNTLKLKVTDTGAGIPKEKQELIFEEFAQAHNAPATKRHEGFGLGLAITKKIVSLLQGGITLESTPGKGAVFTVFFPIHIPDKAIPTEKKKTPTLFSGSTKKRILIVDDEPAQLALTKEVIKKTGLAYKTCSSAKEALAYLEHHAVDLICTDIQMPEIDGFGFLQRLKNNPATKNIPVIALSGKKDVTKEDYQQMGFSASLVKPYNVADFMHLLKNHLSVASNDASQKAPFNDISSTESYSLETVLLFTEGDQASTGAVLRAFMESTSRNMEDLQDAVAKGNHKKAAAIAHKMLPMFRQLKIRKAVAILEKIERPSEYPSFSYKEGLSRLKGILPKVFDGLSTSITT